MDRHHHRTARTPRLVALAVAVGLVVPLAACGTDGELRTGADPTTTAPGGTPTTEPGTDPAPLDLPADQVVWQDTSGGGMAPPSPVAPHVSALTIYGDGRAFVAAAGRDHEYLDPIPIEVGTVAPAELAALVDAAESSGLFGSDDTDFGDPMVTDSGSQGVRFQGRGEAVEVSAYAFEEGFDEGLTETQQRRREQLRDLLEQAEGAVTDLEPVVPDRVVVADLDDSRYRSSPDTPRPWTGPAFDTFLAPTETFGASVCGVLTGADAAAVWEAALADPGTTWADGDDQRELALAVLLPGEEPCTDG